MPLGWIALRFKEIIRALVVAAAGVSVLFLLGRLLHGLVGSRLDLISCSIGAFLTSLFFARHSSARFEENISAAVRIVFGTFFFISIGHGFEQVYVQGARLDSEPLGKFLWATFATSWWLIPGTALTLMILNRLLRHRTHSGARLRVLVGVLLLPQVVFAESCTTGRGVFGGGGTAVSLNEFEHVCSSCSPQLENELAGVQIGDRTEKLKKMYPGIYQHRLALGEVLYEACNQKSFEVFTFTEEPWSPSRITRVWIRSEKDPSVCKDEEGSLPDFGVEPTTPRGLRLGHSKANVLRLYGAPSEARTMGNDSVLLLYRAADSNDVENLTLAVTIEGDKVTSISLSGEMRGAEKTFGIERPHDRERRENGT